MKAVLAVDDVTFITKIYENIFTAEDMAAYTLETAANLTEAKALLSTTSFDLVIIDWMLGGESGLDLVNYLRADEKTAKVPILMISSNGERESITEAAKTGINGYIIKPINKVELMKKVISLTTEQKDEA